MKIVLTGCGNGLGEALNRYLSNTYEIVCLKNKTESYIDSLDTIVSNCDVFINCGYKDKIQTKLFEIVFNKWKYEKKTIINILTSALIFDGPNKKYIEDKRDLESKTLELRTMDKEVRIINVYPNTLENSYTVNNQKLRFDDVCKVIKWIIDQPHDIEIFQIGISKTKLKIENTLI